MTYSVPDHILEETIGEEIALLSLPRETFFSLNASGIALWAEIKNGGGADQLCQLLIERYALDPAQAQIDVNNFVSELLKLDLLLEAASAQSGAQ